MTSMRYFSGLLYGYRIIICLLNVECKNACLNFVDKLANHAEQAYHFMVRCIRTRENQEAGKSILKLEKPGVASRKRQIPADSLGSSM